MPPPPEYANGPVNESLVVRTRRGTIRYRYVPYQATLRPNLRRTPPPVIENPYHYRVLGRVAPSQELSGAKLERAINQEWTDHWKRAMVAVEEIRDHGK